VDGFRKNLRQQFGELVLEGCEWIGAAYSLILILFSIRAFNFLEVVSLFVAGVSTVVRFHPLDLNYR
jgi:hypothetical protein